MSVQTLLLALALMSALAAAWTMAKAGRRGALEVMHDLDRAEDKKAAVSGVSVAKTAPAKYQRMEAGSKVLPLVCALSALAVLNVLGSPNAQNVFSAGAGGLGFGCLWARRRLRERAARQTRALEFFLPIVMERLVMAVHSGYDILSAIRVVLEHDRRQRPRSSDPVCRLIARVLALTEAGRSFEDSLNDVAAQVTCPAVRHAFIHLALAHKEGGELVMPLRELSDATQLYYQESVEEEIARMPIRATLPLLCTFAGLILFFLVPPIMQVLDMTSQAMPHS
ncbi:MAG: type II secretion system F family protein [Oligoflexia bacterium]|nr:type II secretion system F family protein [Oligoflexia bacterium]